jgi:hypothetical protein
MWKNIVERGRPQMTIWRMRIACWIPKATNVHLSCIILIAVLHWLHVRTATLRYTFIATFVLFDILKFFISTFLYLRFKPKFSPHTFVLQHHLRSLKLRDECHRNRVLWVWTGFIWLVLWFSLPCKTTGQVMGLCILYIFLYMLK